MGTGPFVERAYCPHNDDFECAPCVTERHADEHQEIIEGCRYCKFATIQISPAATPSKTRQIGRPREAKNSWERGIARDERGVPLLKGVNQPIGVKEYAEKRHSIESRRQALKHGASASTKE